MSDSENTTPETDSLVCGKMEDEESRQVNQYRATVHSLLQQIGQADLELARLEGQADEIRQRKANLREEFQRVENEAHTFLAQIGERMGIPSGDPWQALPDGTVKRVSPELLQPRTQ